jgi:hypothetical protein
MRETRLYGSEGGGTEINRSFLPLYDLAPVPGSRDEAVYALNTGGVQVASQGCETPGNDRSGSGPWRRYKGTCLSCAHIPGAKAPG